MTTENFKFGVSLSVVGLSEVMHFAWVESRNGDIDLPDNSVPDCILQGKDKVEVPVLLTDESFDAGRHLQGIIINHNCLMLILMTLFGSVLGK